jgi:hypothetical protein
MGDRRALQLFGLVVPLALGVQLAGVVQVAWGAKQLPITITSASPVSGASFTAFPTPYPQDVTFTITTPTTGILAPRVIVASENAVDGYGRLFRELTVESIYLKESERYPETYSGGSVYETWATKPGTYYWQFEGQGFAEGVSYVSELPYLSPVYTLVIAPSPPPAAPTPQAPVNVTEPETPVPNLTVAEAVTAAKSLIHTRSHHNTYRLSMQCELTGTQTATCTATWFTAKHVVGSTTLYAGTFKIDASYEPLTVTFRGVHALDGCAVRHLHHLSRCNSRVTWR